MLALAVFSALSFAHPVPPGQAAASPKSCRTSSNVLGTTPLSPNIHTGSQRIRRVIALIRELQKQSMDVDPLSSHIWRTAPVTLIEQHHRTHSIIHDRCAFGAPWKLRTALIAGRWDYQDILALAGNTCEQHNVCPFCRRPHI